MTDQDPRRRIPPVDRLLGTGPFRELLGRFPRARVVAGLREVQDRVREALARDPGALDPEDPGSYARGVAEALTRRDAPSLVRVVNATGVVLHTNLGRAPLAAAAREAMARVGRGYSNLELDLEAGARGSRYDHCADLLTRLTGAGGALVVNNNAAALLLALNTLARGREVVVSRGELIEIGGGFRIPDMLERAGTRLREVGTTNRTRLDDYAEALVGGRVGAVLKVHRSNFRLEGFTEEASVAALAGLADEAGVPLVHDLGSGLFLDPAELGLPPEPRAEKSLAVGAHVVAVSGDKLLGGPQAGILLGRARHILDMRRNPLCRALRVDKVTLAALEATLRHYETPGEARREIPALRTLARSPAALQERAALLVRALADGGVPATALQGASVVGGGTCPGVEIPSWTVRIAPPEGGSAEALAARLRKGEPPVVPRVEADAVVLDLRTVEPDEEEVLQRRVEEAWAGG